MCVSPTGAIIEEGLMIGKFVNLAFPEKKEREDMRKLWNLEADSFNRQIPEKRQIFTWTMGLIIIVGLPVFGFILFFFHENLAAFLFALSVIPLVIVILALPVLSYIDGKKNRKKLYKLYRESPNYWLEIHQRFIQILGQILPDTADCYQKGFNALLKSHGNLSEY